MLINNIDKASMLTPPSPRLWAVEGPEHPRYGWEEKYINVYGQKFSPWYFAKNCAAVLGHVRAYGQSSLMAEMAEGLFSVASPHIQAIGNYRYIRNDFKFIYLWQNMKPPFYGAFMNNVTAFGLLHLYEATKVEHYLLLADLLLMTSIDRGAPVPLCSGVEGDFWLHEYVFQNDVKNPCWAGIRVSGEWRLARIYNAHIHALLALMRFRAMTRTNDYDAAIEQAVRTMAHWLPSQPYKGQYFSYSPDMPIYPDYGQRRAHHLVESLAQITDNERIKSASSVARNLFASIDGREKEVVSTGASDAKYHYDTMVRDLSK